MTYAFLRGFGFPATDGGDQLRFCNPLVSFEVGESAPIYFVRDLDWSSRGGAQARWFTPLDTDEIETFATIVPETMLQICPGDGVVLFGEQITAAARSLEMEVEHSLPVEFTELPGPRCRIGIANADSYRKLVRQLTNEAASIFDHELSATNGTELSERGETALFVLRKCGFSLPTVLAIRQLAAARVNHQWDRDRRLLIRFSRELKVAEDILDQRVDRHLRRFKGERTSISRKATTSSHVSSIPPKAVRFHLVREYYFKSPERMEPKAVTATLKSDVESRGRTLLRTKSPDPLRTTAVRFLHIGTAEQSFKSKSIRNVRTPSAGFTSPTAPYGAPISGLKKKYEIPTSPEIYTRRGIKGTRLQDMETSNLVALTGSRELVVNPN